MSNTRSPELPEVQRRAMRAELRGVHSWMPGMVVKWDPSTSRANIRPLVRVFATLEDGTRAERALPVITNVPLIFPSGDGFCLTFPIKADADSGTTGRLCFSEVSLDRWLAGTGGLVDSEIDVRFALTDAVFEAGLRPFGNPLRNVPGDHATIGAEDGQRIHFRPNYICIGDEGGAKALVLDGDTVDGGGYVFTAGPPASFTYYPPGTVPNPHPGGFVAITGKVAGSSSHGRGS